MSKNHPSQGQQSAAYMVCAQLFTQQWDGQHGGHEGQDIQEQAASGRAKRVMPWIQQ